MKKKTKKTEDEEIKNETGQESSETTSTEPVSALGETTGTEFVAEVKKIDRLSVGFPNEDMNQVVAKLNELIDKYNG